MPSIDHQALVELFRSNKALAKVLLASVAGVRIGAGEGCIQDSVLTLVTPHEWRPDLVITYHGTDGQPKAAVIVEVQLSRNSDKEEVWPLYITAARARHHCETHLLVVAGDAATASWCTRTIRVGHPSFYLRPVVVGPGVVPVITTVAQARRYPELAILSAFVHRETESAAQVAAAAMWAATHLDGGLATLYNDLILKWLPEAMLHAPEEKHMSLHAMLKNYEWQSDFAKKHRGEGRTEGQAEAVLTVLRTRGMSIDAEHQERIQACGDSEQLDSWLQRAVTASSLDEIFEE